MGGDGGSIPTRRDCIRNAKSKGKEVVGDTREMKWTKWTTCALSGEPLRFEAEHGGSGGSGGSPPPRQTAAGGGGGGVVACRLGGLYNREAVLEALLSKTMRACTRLLAHPLAPGRSRPQPRKRAQPPRARACLASDSACLRRLSSSKVGQAEGSCTSVRA